MAGERARLVNVKYVRQNADVRDGHSREAIWLVKGQVSARKICAAKCQRPTWTLGEGNKAGERPGECTKNSCGKMPMSEMDTR